MARRAATPESVVLRQCLAVLRLRGVLAWRNNTTGVWDAARGRFRTFTGLKGVSDILGVLAPSGRLLAVETKAEGGRLTPAQAAFLDAVRAAGGLSLVVRDSRELDAALRAEGVYGRP
jgi:hypothetical protein